MRLEVCNEKKLSILKVNAWHTLFKKYFSILLDIFKGNLPTLVISKGPNLIV